MDNLNKLATDERYKNVRFASIVCDSCDGARNIIEQDDNRKWDKITHFFMDHDNKEKAKKIFGFKQVPFYVVLDNEGDIVQMGNKKRIDFENLPGMIKEEKTQETNEDRPFEILDLDF